jgi:hypothetical protein
LSDWEFLKLKIKGWTLSGSALQGQSPHAARGRWRARRWLTDGLGVPGSMVEARVEYEECTRQDLGEWDSPMGWRVEWEAGWLDATVLRDGDNWRLIAMTPAALGGSVEGEASIKR